ncbi:MAG: hypothetical protein FWC81_03030 [Coriobacteriia bacterium]|nr:hypothetical protein [Coriobacteriia bacterium]
MCGGSINNNQLQLTIEMAQQQVALSESWMRELIHQASHAGIAEAELKEAQAALKSARRLLEDAVDATAVAQNTPGFNVTPV